MLSKSCVQAVVQLCLTVFVCPVHKNLMCYHPYSYIVININGPFLA